MFTGKTLAQIFHRTDGSCHFCGDTLLLEKYGCKDINDLEGAWEADHIVQRAKGGKNENENCLPACVRCNRLRWHRRGEDIRELLLLGLIVKHEIKRGSPLGLSIVIMKEKRLLQNMRRRRGDLLELSS